MISIHFAHALGRVDIRVVEVCETRGANWFAREMICFDGSVETRRRAESDNCGFREGGKMRLLNAVALMAILFISMSKNAQAQSAKNSAGSPLTNQEKRGEGLFLQRCGACHLSRISTTPKLGKAYGPSLKGVLPENADSDQETSIRQFILKGTGRMPGFQYGLKAEEIDEIVAYLKTL